MKTLICLIAIVCGCTAIVIIAGESQGTSQEPTAVESPLLAKLALELKHGNAKALDKFWSEIKGHAPLVEPIAADSKKSLVTFVWHGDDKTRRVNLVGGPAPTDGESIKWLTRMDDTDLWYRTETVPNDARFVYIFQINRPEVLPTDPATRNKMLFDLGRDDPFNPPAAGAIASLLELSEAPAQPWLEKNPKTPEGKVSSEQAIDSTALKQTRKFKVYTPPGSDIEENTGWLLILFDGEFCAERYPTILDNLIAEKKIPKVTALFVYQSEQRDRELHCWQPLSDFLANELIPQVRKECHTGADPKHVVIGGFSAGGLMAAYCAHEHPELFGNVLSMSGSYWWAPEVDDKNLPSAEPGWLSREFAGTPHLPVRFFLSAGRFENGYPINLLAENWRFRDVLLAKGYQVQYREYSSGHATLCCYTPFVDGLIHLTANSHDARSD